MNQKAIEKELNDYFYKNFKEIQNECGNNSYKCHEYKREYEIYGIKGFIIIKSNYDLHKNCHNYIIDFYISTFNKDSLFSCYMYYNKDNEYTCSMRPISQKLYFLCIRLLGEKHMANILYKEFRKGLRYKNGLVKKYKHQTSKRGFNDIFV